MTGERGADTVDGMATQPDGHHPSVEDYLAGLENPERRSDAQKLCEIMSDVTGEPPVMWGPTMIGFGRYHYRYASGHEGDSALASFAPRKQQLVVYLVGGFDDRHAAQMKKLGPHKTGKGCLYLKRLADVDLERVAHVDRPIRTGAAGPGPKTDDSDQHGPTRRARPPSRPHSPGQ